MKRSGTSIALILLLILPWLASSQALTDADKIIMRMRVVCNSGPGGGLIVALDLYPQIPGTERRVGGYNTIMSYSTSKLNFLGVTQRYETGYWGGYYRNWQGSYGLGTWFTQHNATGTGSALPMTEQYFTPSADCGGNPLNDGYFELLRYTFTIKPGATDSATVALGNFLSWRSQPFMSNNESSATYYADLSANSSDSLINGGRRIWVPVEMSSFVSTALPDGTVELKWRTESETNNYGFELQRNAGAGWEVVTFVEGHGTVTHANEYLFVDEDVRNIVLKDNIALYRIRQIDHDGTEAMSQINAVQVIPQTVGLGNVYPNPVSMGAQTAIPYTLAVPGTVNIAIYNTLGSRVATLVENAVTETGNYKILWNGVSDDNTVVPVGAYFLRFSADLGDGQIVNQTRQMVIIR